MKVAEGRVLIDTNILFYAPLENDARSARSPRTKAHPGL